MKLLKVLNKDLTSPFQDMEYEKDKLYTCKDFDTNPEEDCSRGYYATDWDGLSYSYRKGRDVWECEVGGKSVEYNQFKRRYKRIKLIRKLTLKEIKQELKDASEKAGYDLYHVSFPVSPISGKPAKLKDEHLELLKKWHGIDHKKGTNPFQAAIDLWHMGIVPSCDGEKWRLHSGKNADIIWKGNL